MHSADAASASVHQPALALHVIVEHAARATQLGWPVVFVYVPGAHCAAAVEPVEQKDPAGQDVQALAA